MLFPMGGENIVRKARRYDQNSRIPATPWPLFWRVSAICEGSVPPSAYTGNDAASASNWNLGQPKG